MKAMMHLNAAIISLIIFVMVLIGFEFYARSLEQKYVNALAPLDLNQTINGIALQRSAFTHPDLLPIYGSSELSMIDTPYDAERFFATYPTGFTVFQVANLGMSSLNMAQDLAALGPVLRGKKIIVSFSPANFMIGNFYANNFSPLHAYEMIFSPYLSVTLKIDATKRMLDFPNTLQNDPFLQFATLEASSPSKPNRILYYLSWPLGELQIATMTLQDHAEVVFYLWSNPINSDVQKIPQTIDWSDTLSSALAEQKPRTLSNSFGIEDSRWEKYQYLVTKPIPAGSQDAYFTHLIKTYPEWGDLDILLRVLQELGAQPLILSRPMNVPLWEVLGVSERAQSVYYIKLHKVVDQHHVTLVDFQQYGKDIYFSTDQYSHTSRYGWVYVDQILDAYYHGQIQP
jgi:D-alanine transfer protein